MDPKGHLPLAPIASNGGTEDLEEDHYFMEEDEVRPNVNFYINLTFF
jgi:hypothetical protein